MIFKIMTTFLLGSVTITVEGFFIERFLNICMNKKIFLQDLNKENNTYIRVKMYSVEIEKKLKTKNTYIRVKILKSDFREIKHIARKTKCKVKIEKKSGMPFIINKYRNILDSFGFVDKKIENSDLMYKFISSDLTNLKEVSNVYLSENIKKISKIFHI